MQKRPSDHSYNTFDDMPSPRHVRSPQTRPDFTLTTPLSTRLSIVGRCLERPLPLRDAIGNALIQYIRQSGGCDVAGSIISGC